MKRQFTLVIALLLIAALFAGCGGNGNTPGSETPTASDTPEITDAVEETAEDSPYNFAPGNYEADADGWPTDYYSYETPINTTDEVLSLWTVCYYPQYLPDVGFEGIDYSVQEQETTGVDIEYMVVAYETSGENFSVLLAADDLPDIMAQAGLRYPSTLTSGIDDGYFANIYDYKDYCPNYMYSVISNPDDPALTNSVFLDDTTIASFVGEKTMGLPTSGTMGIRGDWLEEVGKTLDDIKTVDDLEEVYQLFKTELGVESPAISSPEVDSMEYFACYDFYTCLRMYFPNPHVENGKVCFQYTNDNALSFVTRMHDWVAAQIISPDWTAVTEGAFPEVYSGVYGTSFATPQQLSSLDTNTQSTSDPDAFWQILPRVSLYEGQVFHLGNTANLVNWGNSQISAKCENIPLAVTWCDWRYSPEGSFLASYGVEGTTWEYDEGGEIVATDWAQNHPDGLQFNYLMSIWAFNQYCEHGLKITESEFIFDGGKEALQYYTYFQDSYEYDGTYEWPEGVSLSVEESNEFSKFAGDISTYMEENVLSFISGDRPLSEWDAYIQTLKDVGLDAALAAYQNAYDDFLAR